MSVRILSYPLSQPDNLYSDEAFAASAFGEHSLIGTIATITSIMSGVSQPFIAKIADNFSRPIALASGVVFYAIGYAMTAGAGNIQTVAAGQVIYTLGNTGISVSRLFSCLF
jgi:MFS family permease